MTSLRSSGQVKWISHSDLRFEIYFHYFHCLSDEGFPLPEPSIFFPYHYDEIKSKVFCIGLTKEMHPVLIEIIDMIS